MPAPVRLGTRASALALWQANWVAARLREQGVAVDIIHVTTRGDRNQRENVAAIGGEGLFTKEIQAALLDGRIDLAVHSLKDLPTAPVQGLSLAAVPPRAPVNDVLVSRGGLSLLALPPQARVGTGSLRRRAQLWHVRPDLQLADIRGNVDTRLRKLDEGQFDAIVLAEAGISRLGLRERISHRLPLATMLPAVGQGALALETRDGDAPTRQAVAALDDPLTHAAVTAERALLAALRAGCLAPVGAYAQAEADALLLQAVVLSPDGRKRLSVLTSGPLDGARQLGLQAAEDLLRQGAAALIEAARGAQAHPES